MAIWQDRLTTRLMAVFALCMLTPVHAQVAADVGRDIRNPAVRDLQQIRRDVERWQQEREVERMQEIRREHEEARERTPEQEKASAFRFQLNAVEHGKSAILTDEEIDKAVAPWIGREVSMSDIEAMLEAINRLYREKGYVVCEARIKPQRIKNGRLAITLVEGKTGKLTVTGNEHTRESYIRGAFDLEPGEIANYREMSEDLVRFNMTNDVVLRIDIRAGSSPETTDYEITAAEPANWTATVFADTLGTRSTGRPRVGASVTNRSVLGFRDAFTVLGLVSEGSKSFMASYAVPLNSLGTKLTASASFGDVEVVQGPSADDDVKGTSEYYSIRLDHPLYVTSETKWTIYGEWSRQKSTTDFWDITINDTQIDSWTGGLEAILLGERSVFYATAALSHEKSVEETFGQEWKQNIFTGNAFWRYRLTHSVTFTLSGAWQSVVSGDDLTTSQYFYLGHTSGVRGYENDVLSAEQGAYVNAQLDWAFLGPKTSLFAFVDAGRISGTSAYEQQTLASIGAGLTWPLWNGAGLTATVGVPLEKDIGDDTHVNTARFDISLVATW